MPKRRSGGRGGGRSAKRRRQHLYLVFDDWLWGYSIRKIDLSSDSDSDDYADTEQRLPPAVFRLEVPHDLPVHFAAAFGTKIMAMHPMAAMPPDTCDTHPLAPRCVLPTFDVRTRALVFGPRPESHPTHPIYVSIDDRLFALSAGSFELLCPPQVEEPGGPCWARSWYQLPKPPFEPEDVTSYAVHPDGRTIFFSTKKRTTAATFTFHTAKSTEEGSFEWKLHGGWVLPFTDGGVHFDCELDAWVGLSGDLDTFGFLCACDVASTNSAASDGQCPAWKIGKDKLFSEDPLEKHAGATLVYMGGGSRFCLVQCISIEDECVDDRSYYYLEEEEEEPRPCRLLLRVMTFSLKYDKNGDLTTGNTLRILYYSVPYAATGLLMTQPLAFWM